MENEKDTPTLDAQIEQRDAFLAEADALAQLAATEERDMSEDELDQFESLMGNAEALGDAIQAKHTEDRLASARKRLEEAQARTAAVAPLRSALTQPGEALVKPVFDFMQDFKIPQGMAQVGSVRNFKGATPEIAKKKAMRFGMWAVAVATGSARAVKFCSDYSIPLLHGVHGGKFEAATPHNTTTNTALGYLVPEEFDTDMIDLREQFGVARTVCRMVPMGSDTTSRPRRTGGLTAVWVGEGAAGTHSLKSVDLVRLVAKKLMVLSTFTSELDEDSAISIGDDLMEEIAYAFSSNEDAAFFLGDGTSTYGGIMGLKGSFDAVTGTPAGQVTGASGTHTNWAGITLSNFNDMVGVLPVFADDGSAAWHCTKPFFAGVMEKIKLAAGGNTTTEVTAGGPARTFLGYPVVINQKMPKTATAADNVCYLANMRQTADFGDRRQTSIAFTSSGTVDSVNLFETDQLAIRGTERIDINVHDVGDSTDAGPIVNLLTAS